jgi:hypothetical protein
MRPSFSFDQLLAYTKDLVAQIGPEEVSAQNSPFLRFQLIEKMCRQTVNLHSKANCENSGFCRWVPYKFSPIGNECRPNYATLIHDQFTGPLDVHLTYESACGQHVTKDACFSQPRRFLLGKLYVATPMRFLLLVSSGLIALFIIMVMLCPMPVPKAHEYYIRKVQKHKIF